MRHPVNEFTAPIGLDHMREVEKELLAIAVVVPCYKVRNTIDSVLDSIPQFVDKIYCVDDKCPQGTGTYLQSSRSDSRLIVIQHAENQGVGGAVLSGYQRALDDGIDVIVKIDGDGQMDPGLIGHFVEPIQKGAADYTKGNRFFWIGDTKNMPRVRLVGNGILSFLSKFSSGYWNIFDPTNGYTAVHANVLRKMQFHFVSRGYFFESDMLCRLGLIRAVVLDIPMPSKYEDEESSLTIRKIVLPFLWLHIRNTFRRILYMYYLRDFHLASVELLFGLISLSFGVTFAGAKWYASIASGVTTTAGAVMIGGLSIIVGIQFLLGALNFDIQNVPRTPIQSTAGPRVKS